MGDSRLSVRDSVELSRGMSASTRPPSRPKKQNHFLANYVTPRRRSHSANLVPRNGPAPKLFDDSEFQRRSTANFFEITALKEKNAALRAEIATLSSVETPTETLVDTKDSGVE